MSSYFPCPSCGAEYTTDQVAPGAAFACGACGGKVVAPKAVQPVVKPKTVAPKVVAPTAPAPPSVAPTTPAAPAAAPPAAPAAAAPAPTPTPPPPAVKAAPPRSAAKAPARGGKAPAGRGAPARGRRPASAPAAPPRGAKRPAKAKSSVNPMMLTLGGALVVLLAIVLLAVTGGDNKNQGGGESTGGGEAEVEKVLDVTEEFERIKAEVEAQHGASPKSAEEAWNLGIAFIEAGNAIEGTTREHRQVATKLNTEGVRIKKTSVQIDPDFPAYREEFKHRKYDGGLTEYFDVPWLSELQRGKAEEIHTRLDNIAAKDGGWANQRHFDKYDEFLASIANAKTDYEALQDSPWFKKAKELNDTMQADVHERFAKQESVKFPGLKMITSPPYTIFIEDDAGWDPKDAAESIVPKLKGVEDQIREEWKGIIDIKPIEGPVPVLYFRNQKHYNVYATNGASTGGTGALAHFETDTLRLALHDNCTPSTLKHEATHQVLFKLVSRASERTVLANKESFWFHEGMAEWYGKEGELQADRLTGLDTSTDAGRKRLFTVREMLDLVYEDRGRMPDRILNVYAQAWFFIYFLNWYNLDAEGYVDPSKPGVYREQWNRFVKAKIEAKGNGVELFKEQTGFTDADLERIEKEYWRYYLYVKRKVDYRQVNGSRLVRWDLYRNKRGQATGEKSDDLLPPYDPERVPLKEDQK